MREPANAVVGRVSHFKKGETPLPVMCGGAPRPLVFTNGCFDLLHAGHCDFLFRAACLGAQLVVGLNSDRSFRTCKGREPINDEQSRAVVLACHKAVSWVVTFDDETPEALIRAIKPDVLVKGIDWAAKGIAGQEAVLSSGGVVAFLPLVRGISTSRLIERIRG